MKAYSAVALCAWSLLACKREAPDREGASMAAGGASSNAPVKTAGAASAKAETAAKPLHSGAYKPVPAPSVAVETSAGGASPTAPAAAASPAAAGLPAVDFGPAGPLVVQGAPRSLELGTRDWVTNLGWSKDGAAFIACGRMTPQDVAGDALGDRCFVSERGGTFGGSAEASTTAQLSVRSQQLREGTWIKLVREAAGDELGSLRIPKLDATWPFARDLVLSVATYPIKDDATGLRIGGKVKGGDEVFPIKMSVANPTLAYRGEWNAVVANEQLGEIAFVGHFFCMEWCNHVEIQRLPFGKLASLVYNDSGFRLYKKKDVEGARDLFLKATWADPKAPLPPYNLACMYALLADREHAEKALRLAIALGGSEVKARARKDADFKSVLGDAWFVEITR